MQAEGWRRSDYFATILWGPRRISEPQVYHSYRNHFCETEILTHKGSLQFMIKHYGALYGKTYDFAPESFTYSFQSRGILRKHFLAKRPYVWITKPMASSRGRGIKLTRDIEEFDVYLNERLEEKKARMLNGEEVKEENIALVLQEYMENPVLVGGYKFDLRLYVLVTSVHPLKVYLFNEGLARFCTHRYSLEDFNVLRHLTNTSIQNAHWTKGLIPKETELEFHNSINPLLGPGDYFKRTLTSLLGFFEKQGIDVERLWLMIQSVIIKTLLAIAAEPKQTKSNAFELLGFDILLVSKEKNPQNHGYIIDLNQSNKSPSHFIVPKLLEVNCGPSLGVSCTTDILVKMPLLKEMLRTITNQEIDTTRKENQFHPIFPFNQITEIASQNLAKQKDIQDNIKIILSECDQLGVELGPYFP
uniref:Tubulin--tyrosine ligase-like protein 9 n=1 Tax=Arcella intermedia TaxID=1963864 RepID=A0A6B2L4K4_9EUKA